MADGLTTLKDRYRSQHQQFRKDWQRKAKKTKQAVMEDINLFKKAAIDQPMLSDIELLRMRDAGINTPKEISDYSTAKQFLTQADAATKLGVGVSMPAIGHKPSATIARMGKGEAEEAIKKGFDDKLNEISDLINQRYNYLRDHELPPLSDDTLAKLEADYARAYENRGQILEAINDMPQEFLDDIPAGKLQVRDLQHKIPDAEKEAGYVVRGLYGRDTKNITLDPVYVTPSTPFHEGGIHRRQDVWGGYPKENMKWLKVKPEHRKAYLKNRLVMEFQKQLDPKIAKLRQSKTLPYSVYMKQPLEDLAHVIDKWVVNYKKKHGKPPTEDVIMKEWEKRLDKYIDTWIKTSRKGHPKMRQALKNAVDEVEKHVEFANKTMGSEFFKPVIKKTKKK